MQYIQLQGQDPSTVETPVNGKYNLFVNESTKMISVKDSAGNTVQPTETSLPFIELTNQAFIFNPFLGEEIFFEKLDYSDEVDEIDTDIAITRGNNQGIYNPFLESGWDNTDNDGISPLGTEWNKDGWADLTNVANRRYYSFYELFGGQLGNNVRNVELVMHDVANDKYYKFYFTVWGNSNIGAPMTYTRQQIDGISGESIGDEITFVKSGYEDPTIVNDQIDTDLTIARGNNQAIYNIALESGWSQNGDGEDSPEGTLWNNEGWSNLKAISNRNYTTFYNAVGGNLGENILGKELIMYDTINDKYYAIKFSSWTQNNNGGGFSYTRQLLNSSDIFIKPDNDLTPDIFIEDDGNGFGIGITRDQNGGGIFNIYREEGWDSDISPAGTLWNIEGWDDLTNITSRQYQPLYAAFGYGGLGNKIVGTECIMYIPETEQYFAINFLSWTQNNNGGGFSYVRYEINLEQLNEGIIFSDGSKLTSAAGIGKVKGRFAGNRRIEEHVGYAEVSVTETNYSQNTEATVYQDNNGNFDFYVVHTTELETLYDNQDSYTRLEFSFDNGSTWKETVFGGGSRGNYWQLYFPDGQSENYVTVTQGQTLLYRVANGGQPVKWFTAEGSNFRGAIIEFHAYSVDAGTIIGTIHIADDDGDDQITHTETRSGSSDLENVDMWYRNPNGNEREIWFRRLDGESDTLKVQWIAKMFYGSEYYD
jgi:hypothetical protein